MTKYVKNKYKVVVDGKTIMTKKKKKKEEKEPEKKEKSKSWITKKKKPGEVIDTRVEFSHGGRPGGGWTS